MGVNVKTTGFGRPSKIDYAKGGKCSNCGGDRETVSRYCRACRALYMRLTRPKHSEMTEEQRLRANARSYANVYQRRGLLVPEPCACGAVKVEKHHEDYSKPLQVSWVCRKCHLAEHNDHRLRRPSS